MSDKGKMMFEIFDSQFFYRSLLPVSGMGVDRPNQLAKENPKDYEPM